MKRREDHPRERVRVAGNRSEPGSVVSFSVPSHFASVPITLVLRSSTGASDSRTVEAMRGGATRHGPRGKAHPRRQRKSSVSTYGAGSEYGGRPLSRRIRGDISNFGKNRQGNPWMATIMPPDRSSRGAESTRKNERDDDLSKNKF